MPALSSLSLNDPALPWRVQVVDEIGSTSDALRVITAIYLAREIVENMLAAQDADAAPAGPAFSAQEPPSTHTAIAAHQATGGALQLTPADQGMHLVHELPAGRNDLHGNAVAVVFGVFMYFPTLVEVPVACIKAADMPARPPLVKDTELRAATRGERTFAMKRYQDLAEPYMAEMETALKRCSAAP